ncbi:MAG: tetratricopeptide repeat protein, partial [Deltaproteobacteria bacterium]|nr:tetratricopeptide repeat protein [Deltaproteobacteria bacterium]MBW2532587.1 tetratricopeptide repeat protein [Deltaproteobacteria bacterium]
MRPRVRTWLVALALLPAVAGAQDFDPSGRRRPPRPVPGTPGPRRPPAAGPKKGPSADVLIARYTKILLEQPAAAFPLQKLSELYRKRDGSLDGLIAEFESRAQKAGPAELNTKLALAAIYRHARRVDDAKRILTAAASEQPKRPTVQLMLATLAESQGDRATARTHYEAALPLLKAGIDKERATRTLMKLCLDLEDYPAAGRYHAALVRAAGGSLYVEKELGRELMSRGKFSRAEAEFRKIVKASTGDNRALAPALRDLGHALAKQKKLDAALEVLERARRVAGTQAGIRAEILALLTEVFREQGKLTELIAVLESERGRDFQRLATIGALYEETGQVDKALQTYRDALKLQPKNIDTRVKLVHLLQTAGQLEEAIKQYEALIRSARHNADFVFELAETLIQRGERDRALKHLSDLERKAGGEPDVLSTVADFYERIEEPERAIKVLERLAKTPAGDPQHIIDLGDRYYQAGKTKRAKETWARIRAIVPSRARASALLGEVYLEHDMPSEALAALREATKLAPRNLRYRKALATALERTATSVRSSRHRYAEALSIWEQLLAGAGDDRLLEREARTHVVSLWAIMRQLPSKVAPLEARLMGKPPDLVAGRLLAEVQRRLHELDDAERTLRRITQLAPGDESSLLALERILVMQRNLNGAIDVLEKLVEVNPKRAREYYQRMASYAAELYRDDDAIRYAARAVELSPDDAVGHHRLGRMYRRRQDLARAKLEFRKAIAKNDRLFAAYFDLAELLVSDGDVRQADRLYRRVVRACRDEQYVARAARLSMQINLGRGTLESLERELLPVALGNPQKKIYRRLLVELYGAMTFPLVHAARFGAARARAEARRELTRIGTRAVKPLLDALADERQAQQRIAIEVLAYVQNRGA